MAERPILFNGSMVKAILAGTKTQTRRTVKLPKESTIRGGWEATTIGGPGVVDDQRLPVAEEVAIWNQTTGKVIACPFGVVGDRLWVKEAIKLHDRQSEPGCDTAVYAADGQLTLLDTWPWKRNALPGMFMPRGLSRLTLEITGVRVERLQAITEADALAEGVIVGEMQDAIVNNEPGRVAFFNARDAFASLWCGINGADSWRANPWVWVVEFKRVDGAV